MKTIIPAVIAHRGLSSRYPENTLASISAALDEGVDMIEVDVAQTADHVPVILHDLSLNRTTNGKGNVHEVLLKDLKLLDAGSWFNSEFSKERVPTLKEVLELVNGRCTILLEIKAGRKIFPGIERNIAKTIREYNASEWVIAQSFENDVLKKFRSVFPDLRLHKLVTGNLPGLPLHIDSKVKLGRITRYKTFDAINISHRLLNKRKLKKIRERGQKVFVWTVNTEEDMERIIRMGVDGIITDYPDRLKKVISKIKKIESNK